VNRKEVTDFLLDELYEMFEDLNEKEAIDNIYAFLLEIDEESTLELSGQTEIMDVEIVARKEDMLLTIMLTYYKDVIYNANERGIRKEEKEILEFLGAGIDSIDVVEYFKANPEEGKKVIGRYFLYAHNTDEYKETVEKYSLNNPTPFVINLSRDLEYLNFCDDIAEIYEDVLDEFSEDDCNECECDLNEECEYCEWNEDDYEKHALAFDEKVLPEITDRVIGYIKSKLQVPEKINDFLKYYVSLTYSLLTYYEREIIVSIEERRFLRKINECTSLEEIMELFEDKETFAKAVGTVSLEYLATYGSCFDFRYSFDEPKTGRILKLLDPEYEYYEDERNKEQVSGILRDWNVGEKIEEILAYLQQKYPEDYIEKAYDFFTCSTEDDNNILHEYDIEETDKEHLAFIATGYLSRQFYEYHFGREANELTDKEAYIYGRLLSNDKDSLKLIRTFFEGGHEIINVHYRIAKEREFFEKQLIRDVIYDGKGRELLKLDPYFFAHELTKKAVMEGDFYSILEENGVDETIKYMHKIEEKIPYECNKNCNELLMNIYLFLKNKKELNDTDEIILNYIEKNSWSIEDYKNDLLCSEPLLRALLEGYLNGYGDTVNEYESETDEMREIRTKLKVKKRMDNHKD